MTRCFLIVSILFSAVSFSGSSAWAFSDPASSHGLSGAHPTTVPRGELGIRTDWFVILGLEYGLTESTQIGLFPISPFAFANRAVGLNLKQQLIRRESFGFGLSLRESVAWVDGDFYVGVPSPVIGVGNRDRSLSATLNWFQVDGDWKRSFVLSGDLRLSHHWKLLAEYMESDAYLLADDAAASRIVLCGLRRIGEDSAYTFALVFDLDREEGDPRLIPWISFYFL